MNSTECVVHKELGFDNELYLQLQKDAILERLSHFPQGTLYLEIGGHFLTDPHAQRVLPGFEVSVKPEIIKALGIPFEIIFCANAQDIAKNRMLSNRNGTYVETVVALIREYQATFHVPIAVAINLVEKITPQITTFRSQLAYQNIPTYLRYVINGYPEPSLVVSEQGYGKDEYIPTESQLVLVIGPASNSGKLSTCLGQIYHDITQGKDSGYAKLELFPIWNYPLKHPVNLAYEAATADIGDYNLVDPLHFQAHHVEAINYNRDVEAFPIISKLLGKMVAATNYLHTYKSPTDMGINRAGFAITDSNIVAQASYEEILRRIDWFDQQVQEGRGKEKWVKRCKELAQEAQKYLANPSI
ncbi:hypothetical protein CO112_01845 [Candidatus Dojkabacteria bacterium CG_4_9_14_3_um_filter_150_Dojkabacteria_WS6_41_13]|uniref:DUF1846 domain-containing protein n=1 Tax=Candidatus Dojkabacteria bacterium CG_4_10_14_0_2_um_filter_Dojkabacteria_WS6_41_15 TaxID=2014249 RepID=A0A2M7W0H9_9BACT|nr:MAG: hypothetical protein COZ14_00135 [Candidatus Dojkabacteria bacterium CG_4_10_14_3_um_filter_Dojkabacteria_WS6_41_9]PJA12072.1 MAG: hypothetical protein COX64_05160 [Candidatus Dojkabacteria bacterium CG_4_10_14_0_2_um_filter_Dojkabacteria_WS6_41_15]PJB22907.1 MAG: hypothetical protein CO112_01845 [Candidatus Dojkabacteria bacterium CG_4_9_14_3_um_filter_150_Dojkabacteria_WS6_41_13]